MAGKIKKMAGNNFGMGLIGSAVVAAVVAGAGVLAVAGIGKQSIDIEFSQAAGLREGAKVRAAGVEIGRVAGVELEGDHVLATVDVDSDVKFGPDAKAEIKMATVLGQTFVSMTPGDHSGLPGDRIPINNTSVPFNLAKVVRDPQYKSQFERLEDIDEKQAVAAIETLGQQLEGAPQDAVKALESVGELSRIVAKRQDQVDTLMKSLGTVSKTLGENRNSILTVITQGESIANAVMERQALIRDLMTNVATLSAELKAIGDENGGQFTGLIDSLNMVTDGLKANEQHLNELFDTLPPAMRMVNNAFGDGNYANVYLPWVLFPENWLCAVHVVDGCSG